MKDKDKSTDVPLWFLILALFLIGFAGISGVFLPYPTAWIIPSDCEYLEGRVVHNSIEEKFCIFGSCVGDHTIVVEPDDGGDNKSVHVSPVVSQTHPVGSRYESYLCA